jgi:hypothetical protein
MPTIPRTVGVAVSIAATLLLAGSAAAAEQRDLRDLFVGMPVDEIPAGEYAGLACAAAPDRVLADWALFRECPADADGRRAVSFRFDDRANSLARVNDKYEGTKVGGHPVRLTLLFDAGGIVDVLRIDTDPEARLFWRKKAHLLAGLAKNRYGEDGWTCRDVEPAAGEAPVGGVFIKRHCEKTTDRRRLRLDEAVYRRAGQKLSDFVNEAHLEIRLLQP